MSSLRKRPCPTTGGRRKAGPVTRVASTLDPKNFGAPKNTGTVFDFNEGTVDSVVTMTNRQTPGNAEAFSVFQPARGAVGVPEASVAVPLPPAVPGASSNAVTFSAPSAPLVTTSINPAELQALVSEAAAAISPPANIPSAAPTMPAPARELPMMSVPSEPLLIAPTISAPAHELPMMSVPSAPLVIAPAPMASSSLLLEPNDGFGAGVVVTEDDDDGAARPQARPQARSRVPHAPPPPPPRITTTEQWQAALGNYYGFVSSHRNAHCMLSSYPDTRGRSGYLLSLRNTMGYNNTCKNAPVFPHFLKLSSVRAATLIQAVMGWDEAPGTEYCEGYCVPLATDRAILAIVTFTGFYEDTVFGSGSCFVALVRAIQPAPGSDDADTVTTVFCVPGKRAPMSLQCTAGPVDFGTPSDLGSDGFCMLLWFQVNMNSVCHESVSRRSSGDKALNDPVVLEMTSGQGATTALGTLRDSFNKVLVEWRRELALPDHARRGLQPTSSSGAGGVPGQPSNPPGGGGLRALVHALVPSAAPAGLAPQRGGRRGPRSTTGAGAGALAAAAPVTAPRVPRPKGRPSKRQRAEEEAMHAQVAAPQPMQEPPVFNPASFGAVGASGEALDARAMSNMFGGYSAYAPVTPGTQYIAKEYLEGVRDAQVAMQRISEALRRMEARTRMGGVAGSAMFSAMGGLGGGMQQGGGGTAMNNGFSLGTMGGGNGTVPGGQGGNYRLPISFGSVLGLPGGYGGSVLGPLAQPNTENV